MIYKTNVRCPNCHKYMNAVSKGNNKYYFRCICCEDGYEKIGSLSIDFKLPQKNRYNFISIN